MLGSEWRFTMKTITSWRTTGTGGAGVAGSLGGSHGFLVWPEGGWAGGVGWGCLLRGAAGGGARVGCPALCPALGSSTEDEWGLHEGLGFGWNRVC